MYVPNPQQWVRFFEKIADGKAKFGQSGGARKMEIIAIDKCASNGDSSLPIKAVAPAEQTVQQAASELKRENINPDVAAKMIQNPEKRRRKRKGKIVKIKRKTQIGGRRKQIGGRKKKTVGRRKKQIGGRRKQVGGRKKQSGGRKKKAGGGRKKRKLYKDVFGS